VDRAGLTYYSMLQFSTPQVAQAVATAGRDIAVVSDDARFDLHPLDIVSAEGALHIQLYAAWDRKHHAASTIGALAKTLSDFCVERYGPPGRASMAKRSCPGFSRLNT